MAGSTYAMDCQGPDRVSLRQPVTLSDAERQGLPAEPLRVGVVDGSAPLATYGPAERAYRGISIDIFCFIVQNLGLDYRFVEPPAQSLNTLLTQVQQGELDMLFPLSRTAERSQRGLFTDPYYQTYYVVVARRDRDFSFESEQDLNGLRVGYFERSAIEPLLHRQVDEHSLRPFPSGEGNNQLFRALSAGEVDVVVVNKVFFEEKRYANDFFDLNIIYTLYDSPRDYSFYFHSSGQNRDLVGIFNRYLEVMDITPSMNVYEIGEERLIQRYIEKAREQDYLWLGLGALTLALLVLSVFFWMHRRASQRLRVSNARIQQQQMALERVNQQLEQQSQTDALTGLHNRRRFEARAKAFYAGVAAGEVPLSRVLPLSMMLLDLDLFKRVNDVYGHDVGDTYLRQVAAVLKSVCQYADDEVIRYGGEEFLCVLPATPHEQACRLAERIRQAVLDLRCPNRTELGDYLTISAGVATSHTLPSDPHLLISAADEQLYRAKKSGRNRVSGVVVTP